MASAALRVFAIPELLETVLQFLPLRDLLLDQRVNTAWQATTKSPTLQHQLHYKDTISDLDRHTHIEWTPLSTFMTDDDKTSLPKDWLAPHCQSHGIKGDPIKQSWNDMFVTRPAVSEIHVQIPTREHMLSGTVKNANGVTIGQLRETEWIHAEAHRRCAEGVGTGIRFSVYTYGLKSVRSILLFSRFSRRSYAVGWSELLSTLVLDTEKCIIY